MADNTLHLIDQATCPHCWHRFAPHDTLFIARHSDLLGDSVAGPSAYLRFLPSRFTAEGNALDPCGVECRELACPRCHLEITRATLQTTPLFASIIGAPASGKSYYLAAMTWHLRQKLPALGWSLVDADTLVNERLHHSEQRLFLAEEPDRPVALDKTPTSGTDLYQTVSINGTSVTYPKPFQFIISPRDERSRQLRRVLVLYDNAGEHFLPGQETGATPMTEHLARSQVLMFLLDPTQDPRMRAICRPDDPQVTSGPRGAGLKTEATRQETIVAEVGNRIRRASGKAHNAKPSVPLIVIVAKADLWQHHVGDPLLTEPFLASDNGGQSLDVRRIKQVSGRCRELLSRVMPEFVAAAEWLSSSILYVPVTALGRSPELIRTPGGNDILAIRPSQMRPGWATVPMLCALQSIEAAHFKLSAEPHAGGPNGAAAARREKGARA